MANEPQKWANLLGSGADVNTIPEETPAGTGAASMKSIFPPITQVPLYAGGISPDRADFNGLFKLLGDNIYYQQQGGVYSYDSTIAYAKGSLVKHNDKIYIAIQANGPATVEKEPGEEPNFWQEVVLSNTGIIAAGTTTARSLENRFADVVNVKDFGAVGDGVTDDTLSIQNANTYCSTVGKTLYFPHGMYCITSSITKSVKWVGDGAPHLAPFPLLEDDKIYLRNGYKYKMPGSSILVKSGTYTEFNTARTDMFSSFTYAIKTEKDVPSDFEGIGIIQDMNILDDDGNITNVATDNRADGCDVAYFIDDASRCEHYNFVVFGYWNKAGTIIYSGGSGDNPDYNKFFGGSTSGYYGLALVGNDTNLSGLSGTQCYGFQIFANDHHSRLPQTLKAYQDNGYGHCLFIDGITGAVRTNIQGHSFVGGGIRTYSNTPIELDHCNNVTFTNVAFELPDIENQADTLNTKFKATINTDLISFYGCRSLISSLVDNIYFGDVIKHLIISGLYDYGDIVSGSMGNYAAIRSVYMNDTYTPSIDFTDNLYSIVSGTKLYKDVSSGAIVQDVRAEGRGDALTISNGSIAPTRTYHAVFGEDSSADDLNTILGTFIIGQRLILMQGSQSQPITIKNSGGNIRFSDSSDHTLGYQQGSIELIYNGTYWTEPTSRAFNHILRPTSDNTYSIGTASYRWKDIYCGNPTINTSDERLKTEITDPNDALMKAWGKVNFKVFKFKDAIEKKGDNARKHVGVIAQDVQKAFESEGLNASDYGLFCYDEWEDQYDKDEEGNEVLVQKAGNAYGIRYTEALALECAYQRWLGDKREARIKALEAKLK